MNLQNIPAVALREIVEFLDEKSLVQLQQSCRALCCFIKTNRTRLVDRLIKRIYMLRIMRLDNSASKMPSYYVELTCGYAPGPQKHPIGDTRKCFEFIYSIEHDVFHSSLFEWLARAFSNIQIEYLYLRRLCMEEERTDKAAVILRKRQLHIEYFCLEDTESLDNNICKMLKLVKDIGPRTLMFYDMKFRNPGILMTKPLLDCMSTLSGLQYWYKDCNVINGLYGALELAEFPKYVDKIPPRFLCTSAFTMDFGQLKRMIHNWYNNGETVIEHWSVSIIGDRGIVEMGEDLALPCSLSEDPRNPLIIIWRPIDGISQRMEIRKTQFHNKPTDAYGWTIFVG